ncbi:hypothetical protein [Anaerococcus cruorum]|uniref:hypothetical protein n=1 Tax=Anaerococcus sp. WGS1529 TaxID=3366812 RepID=UPI00372D0A2D
MIYLITAIFLILAGIIFYRGKDIVLKPAINKMDILSILLVWIIFIVFGYFIKFKTSETFIMCLVMSIYVLAVRLNRGFLPDGFIFQGNVSFINQKHKFTDLKQVNLKTEDNQAVFTLVVNSNSIDTWRFPLDKKDEILKIFKDNNIPVVYK